MSTPQLVEGEADFHVPSASKPCKTWYSVSGDLHSGVTPLIALHGGPGIPGRYLKPLYGLSALYGIPVVLYDQLGCGNSTHLPDKKGDTSFWTIQLFQDELDNLLTHLRIQDNYDLLGHSWGGVLAATHAALQPKGLRRLIIANSPASLPLWAESARRLRKEMPEDVQEKLRKGEEDGTTDSEEYQDADMQYQKKHVCRMEPLSQEMMETVECLRKDSTVVMTMFGASDVYITGSLKDWSIGDKVHQIAVPTLLIHGRYDTAQDEVVQPYFDGIAKVKWVRFQDSSHMPQLEERERYLQVVGGFLSPE